MQVGGCAHKQMGRVDRCMQVGGCAGKQVGKGGWADGEFDK